MRNVSTICNLWETVNPTSKTLIYKLKLHGTHLDFQQVQTFAIVISFENFIETLCLSQNEVFTN